MYPIREPAINCRSNSRFTIEGSVRTVPPYRSPAIEAAYSWSRNRRGVSIFASTAGRPGTMMTPVPVDTSIKRLHWSGFWKANCWASAPQFAFQNPLQCRRLILVSTGTGVIMVPGRPAVLAKMLTPRRFLDHEYAASIAGDLYGGTVRTDPSIVKRLFDRQLMAGSRIGYMHQLLAGSVWTSIFALPAIRQRTLVIAGLDDPVVPLVNARIMSRLLPHSTLHLHAGGHIDVTTNAAELAPVIEKFRSRD